MVDCRICEGECRGGHTKEEVEKAYPNPLDMPAEIALQVIASENSEKRQQIVKDAVELEKATADRYHRGLITPRDFANDLVLIWAEAYSQIKSAR